MPAPGGRQYTVWDPKTEKFDIVDICGGSFHLNFASDANNTMWTGTGGLVGWVNSKIWDETKDAGKAQGWTELIVDTNSNGKRMSAPCAGLTMPEVRWSTHPQYSQRAGRTRNGQGNAVCRIRNVRRQSAQMAIPEPGKCGACGHAARLRFAFYGGLRAMVRGGTAPAATAFSSRR